MKTVVTLKAASRWIKIVEKIKTHILYSITFSRKSCRLSENVEKCGSAWEATKNNKTWRIRFARWISNGTGAHARTYARPRAWAPTHLHTREYTKNCVIIIVSPPQRESTSMLRYTYIACLVYDKTV